MFYSLYSNHLFKKVSLKIFNLHFFPQVIEIFPFVRVALTTFLLSMNFDNCLSAGILSQINSLLNYIYIRVFQQSKLNCLWQLLWTNTFSQRIQFLVSRFKFQRARCSISWRAAQNGQNGKGASSQIHPLEFFFMRGLAKKEKEAMLLCIVDSWPRSSNYVVNDLPRFYLIRIIINQIMLERDLHKNNE